MFENYKLKELKALNSISDHPLKKNLTTKEQST
jgi:hypothetical protein